MIHLFSTSLISGASQTWEKRKRNSLQTASVLDENLCRLDKKPLQIAGVLGEKPLQVAGVLDENLCRLDKKPLQIAGVL